MLATTMLAATMLAAVAFGQEVVPSGESHGAAVEGTLRSGSPYEGVSNVQQESYDQSDESPDPQSLLEDALRILEMRRSVVARIRQEIDLFGKRLVGSGIYLEQLQGRDRLVRLELKIQHGEQASSLVQVAALPDKNGRRFLWTKRKVLDTEQLSRIDLDQVAKELERADTETPRFDQPAMLQAEGGLAKILRGLHASFDFTDAQLGRLGKQGQLVWRIQGQWKPEQLARAVPKLREEGRAATPLDPSRLPPHLPDLVVLHLRHEDLFPYRIEYRRTVSQRSTRAMVTMEFYDIVVDMAVSPRRFEYNPGDLDYTDDTADYLDSLRGEK
ncbi:MAG: hypothetical protein V3R99_00610 [Thermoguttaceae bacterium]